MSGRGGPTPAAPGHDDLQLEISVHNQHSEYRAMDLVQEFQKHAADCELMAKLTRDAASKAQWQDLAERFRQCADRNTLATKESRRLAS
jgi:hypothetical protein